MKVKSKAPLQVKKVKKSKMKTKSSRKDKILHKKSGKEKDFNDNLTDKDESEEIDLKQENTNTKKSKKFKNKCKDDEVKQHKKELEKLKDIDPEFYKFLKQNDKKLLDFNFYDSDSDEDDNKIESEKDDEDNDEDDEFVHKPNEKLEVASDESDFETSDIEEHDDSKVITLKLLKLWQSQLHEKHVPIDIIRKIIQAFNSALSSISGDVDTISTYKVDGSAAFNGVIQLCVLHLQPAIYKFLGISSKSKKPLHKCAKWKKVRSCLRSYLIDLTKLLESVSSVSVIACLLKHLHQLSSMLASFPTISKPIIKRLIVLWSTSEETTRVLSFLCILKITRNLEGLLLNHVLKAMYLAYVRNSKFVSPNTLPGINFMRRSLKEMFTLDLNIAYQHAFLYIRQLAIHLRNAVILKKKDSFQAVYNWQYINSIKLWCELLGSTSNKSQLQPLIYPLVSITIGVIKLIPTAQYFPLRFHCIQSLIILSREANTFIPILPFILEVLNSNTFNKKHTIVSMKPMQFTCILRLNKSQLAENGFRDEVIENVVGLILEYLAHESNSIAYPDLIVPAVVSVKHYLKKCKNSNYVRKLKTLVDKIMENSKYIEDERRKINYALKETNLIKSWETSIRNKGTPLSIYYSSWLKTHETKKKRQAANTDDINDYDIPMIKRKKTSIQEVGAETSVNGKSKLDDLSGVELFPSDSEDEQIRTQQNTKDSTLSQLKKQKRQIAQQKVESEQKDDDDNNDDDFDDNCVDIVKDLDTDDW